MGDYRFFSTGCLGNQKPVPPGTMTDSSLPRSPWMVALVVAELSVMVSVAVPKSIARVSMTV